MNADILRVRTFHCSSTEDNHFHHPTCIHEVADFCPCAFAFSPGAGSDKFEIHLRKMKPLLFLPGKKQGVMVRGSSLAAAAPCVGEKREGWQWLLPGLCYRHLEALNWRCQDLSWCHLSEILHLFSRVVVTLLKLWLSAEKHFPGKVRDIYKQKPEIFERPC